MVSQTDERELISLCQPAYADRQPTEISMFPPANCKQHRKMDNSKFGQEIKPSLDHLEQETSLTAKHCLVPASGLVNELNKQ